MFELAGRFATAGRGTTGRSAKPSGDIAMPTLIRLIVWLAILAGIAYGGMFALATFVHNEPGEMTERVRLDNLRLE
jgi:hypothetical protein